MATDSLPLYDGLFSPQTPVAAPPEPPRTHDAALGVLRRTFQTPFAVLDARSGHWIERPEDQPRHDSSTLFELARRVAELGRPEILAYEDPLAVLAVPLVEAGDCVFVATAMFVVRPVLASEDLSGPAEALGLAAETAAAWSVRQIPWSADALLSTAALVVGHSREMGRLRQLEEESQSLSVHLAATYEEISLLYRLTQNLRISESDEELGRVALEWMEGVIPAEGLAIQYLPITAEDESLTHQGRSRSKLLSFGRFPLDNEAFSRLIDFLNIGPATRPTVVNRRTTSQSGWPFAEVRELITVPLVEGENLFGWLAAVNHVDGAEFGTVEASLLSSVGAILGIHSGNIELYRQQAELLAGVVRALTSAIDAKDPYTCGHSDRVARVAVRLAQELGCDAEKLNTIYLSGLLHDIGKIGIDDNVLRKPGSLTSEEYEHIKTHVKIGHRILTDLKKLDTVLPVVLHHHESWDGKGYPDGIPAEQIPLVARIIAVADSFDAMGSDRPYRKGMPDEKIDSIFRAGAGKQWDPAVVEAFFRCREDVRRIMREDQEVQVIPPQ